jgi:hypothetical protein
MAGKIFINYRRDDSISTAGRLHDRLAQTFGRNNLFMDVDHIPAGVDFLEYLHSQVAACDVFLAVIGPSWLDAKDDDGRRRFDNPDDFVTIEIAEALARNIRVIPVLVDGARMPKADKLPDSVKPLVRRNAVEVRNTRFGRDAEMLASKVGEALKDARPVRRQWPFMASAAARLMVAGSAMALLLVGWIGLYQMGVPVWVPWTRPEQADAPGADKAKAAADAEAKRKAEEAEQQRLKDEEQRQAKAAADAEAKRKAAEAEQQRLKEEQQRQAQAAADAEAKRKAEEAEQQRLAAAKAEEGRKASTQAAAPAAQKVVLYEEDPADPNGKRFVGSAIWRTETVTPGPGQPPELAIRADVEVPERKLAMTWSLRRNTDKGLPATHTVEIMFKLPADFPSGGISNVPGILMKQAEQTRGTPLAGLAVKVTPGFYMIGLSNAETDKDHNLQLLKERSWFDIPVVYNNNRRAIIAMEKGTPGERVFADVFKAWKQ